MDIKKLRELCEKATPGPWGVSRCGYDVFAENTPSFNDPSSRMVIAQCLTADDGKPFNLAYKIAKNDAQFIAAARTALPELLDEVEILRKALHLACTQRDELIKALEILEKIFADKDFIEEDESEDFLHYVWTLAHGTLYNLKRELARRNEIPEART